MEKFFRFLWLIIVMVVFSALLPAAETEEDIFGGKDVGEVIAMAEAGDAEAQIALAQRYRFGVDVSKDPAKAVEWFQKAAEQGNVQAQFSVGYMYAAAEGGFERNLPKAVEWYRKAAEGGHANAQVNLGNMYRSGDGVSKDLPMTLYWFQKAADQGYAMAQIAMAGMYANGDGVPRDQQKAIALYHDAADQGNARAQAIIARMYVDGDGVPRDLQKAIALYQKAAEQGDVMAQMNLANIYAEGKIVPQNLAAMAELYRKAAEQGNPSAQYNLGLMYYSGNGVNEDQATAFQWLQKAAHQRNPMAQRDLGHMYRNGRGVKKDEIEGMAWIYLADNARPIGFPNPEISALEQKLGKKKIATARQRSEELRQSINSELTTRTAGTVSTPIGKPTGSGAGAVISTDGLILTAAHTVAVANSIKIGLPTSNRLLDAKILEIDKERDLAILKCEVSATHLTVTSSEHIRVGQTVFGVLSQSPAAAETSTIGTSYSHLYIQELTGGKKKTEYLRVYTSADTSVPRSKDGAVRFLSGASGPLLDEAGNLVGMIPAQTPGADGSINILKSEAMRPWLEKYGVNVVDSQGDESMGTSNSNLNAPPMMRLNRAIVMILTY